MQVNELPKYDNGDNPTGCCPRLDPQQWDELELRFQDKLFLKSVTRSLFHIPLNMGAMMTRTMKLIEDSGAFADDFLLLSHDPSLWRGEHLFAVKQDIPGAEMVRLSGTFVTKVFEGPFREMPRWQKQLTQYAQEKGKSVSKTYMFYATCPKCSKQYGKNYVVGFAQVDD